ncbi:MAG: molybdopterin-dependent oxidoreductase [Anaerolineae bacterium]|nr:molybdopterin-dependent oxidoreductase [Anaerolineae bacterium]MDQ7035962.1 molybdopterin-dependent oxidoreductase [Anaerolineae bacterium]
MSTRMFGSGIKRREDPRLITGKAKYTDDIKLPGTLHMAVVRSPHAHANIKGIDTSAAEAMPGVVAVYTGEAMNLPIPTGALIPDCNLITPEHPSLAKEKVRYVGDGVAIVLAENRYQAQDAADVVKVDYEVLGAIINPEDATKDGAPQLFDDVPNNVAFRWLMGGAENQEASNKVFEAADVVVKERIVQQRLQPTTMEPRAALAQWNAATEEMTLWVTTQNPHIHRVLLSGIIGVPEHKLRIIAPEVGGGFGAKIDLYPDEALACWASLQTGRPVKWTETRSENYVAMTHGRDHVEYVELAATKDGKVTGIRSTVYAGMGAYLTTFGAGIPTILHALIYCGVYAFENAFADVIGAFTSATPVEAYRGAGRPEATFLVERLMDKMANALDMDPTELRRKNLIPKFEDGYAAPTGVTYDSGDYEPALDKVLEMAGYSDFRKEQEEARKNGKYLGIGVTTYTEICGLGPSEVNGAIGFQAGGWESSIIRMSPTGKAQVLIGVSPHGQGGATSFAQIFSDGTGIPMDDIEVVHGDTNTTPMGWGTYGSRNAAVGGAALAGAITKFKDKAKVMAAHMLEAAVEDIEYEDGQLYVKGSPDNAKAIQEIVLMSHLGWDMPAGAEPSFEVSNFYNPPNFVYPFGAHIAIVEIDAETGTVELKRYLAVDDCGHQINPMIVAGQIHGGLAQGIGQALCEGSIYDDNGQLLTGSMMDYAVPRADMFPNFELDHTVTPSPHQPLGIKGVGETGTIASTPTVYNAVMDALKPLSVESVDMPLTPYRVWEAIQNASNGGSA